MVVIYRTALQLDFNLRKLRQLVSLPGGTAGTFRKSKMCHDILSIRFFRCATSCHVCWHIVWANRSAGERAHPPCEPMPMTLVSKVIGIGVQFTCLWRSKSTQLKTRKNHVFTGTSWHGWREQAKFFPGNRSHFREGCFFIKLLLMIWGNFSLRAFL